MAHANTSIAETNKRQQKTDHLLKQIELEVQKYYGDCLNADVRIVSKFVCEDDHLELWDVALVSKSDPTGKDKRRSWAFFWDGAEFTSYDSAAQATKEFVAAVKQRRVERNWSTWFGPLAISGYLAILLTLSLAIVVIWQIPVPQAYWPVVTSVIAFYFGRQAQR